MPQVAKLPLGGLRRALLALLQVQTDVSALPPAQSLREQQASRSAALLLVHESAPWVALAQPLRAPPVQLALPLARRELPVRWVSPPLVPPARQVSSARLSQPLRSLLFQLWQPLPPALPLRRFLESFCALSQRRPRGSSSSASSFP